MNTMSAFAMGMVNRGKEPKVFDWHKAAQLIKESGYKDADAGLSEDWFWTGAAIFRNGEVIKEHNAYLSSTWATPVIRIDGVEHECWKMESETDGWNAHTSWMQSAIDILKGEEV